jgi:hypothetical protein
METESFSIIHFPPSQHGPIMAGGKTVNIPIDNAAGSQADIMR